MKLRRLVLAGFSLLSTASFAQDFNYGEVLQKSILFYETQQSGVLPDWNRISWRGDSGVNDGADVGLDLTGGWYDAGDHMKFGFPMAFSVSALNWGYLEYKDGYDAAEQTEHFKRNIKWVTDYFIKCHPSANEFYAQVADAKGQDHNFWMPAEMIDVHPAYGQRLSYKLDTANPGTEVSCETAAALASASIVFKDSDPAYSATLLEHAIQLYEFGDTYRGTYTAEGNIPAVGTYSAGGFEDELTWGALWLYKATGDESYLAKAESHYQPGDFLWSFVWDDKSYGNMVILAQLTGKQVYIDDCETHLQFWIDNDSGITYSPGGQAHLTTWGSLRHSMNASLTALIYSDNVATANKDAYHDFAVSQVKYALGDNPINRSFVTGFGNDPAHSPHHRGQHSSWSRSDEFPVDSRHTLWGALVGGPATADDSFVDDRGDFIANEVATDYNACFQGVIARMVMEFGGTPLANFPQPETPGVEFVNEAKIGQNSDNLTQVNIWLNNRSGWPARVPNKLTAKYFIDITEGIEAGYSVDDYTVSAFGEGGEAVGGLQVWDRESNIYFAEVQVYDDKMPFPGGQGEYRTEIQLRIALPPTAPSSAWDTSNDFSFTGLTDELVEVQNLPIYADDILVGGQEPEGGDTPKALFTATPETGFAPLVVEFDSSESSDPNGDNITYAWVFGNGETSTLANPTITFDEIGSFEVSLTVSDGVNTSYAFTKTITTEDPNVAPVAVISASTIGGIAPQSIDFDASGSTDENGDDLTYTWDFGDGTSSTLESPSHTYTDIGEYDVLLTVSDGVKLGSDSITITITDGSPVISYSYTVNSVEAPFEVDFDASNSVDPEGGMLSYSWDFGNDTTANTSTASATYTEDGDYTVLLTITNESGKQDSEEFIVSVGNSNCIFDTPRATALPNVDNVAYENIFVLGEDGPNMENVTTFTLNWNLNNSGLYQFAFNLSVSPNYIDFSTSTQNFNSSQPEITLSGTGINGLDGSYYVTLDEENFVMVSKTEGFTLYFSQSADEPACSNDTNIDLSNPVLDLANYEIKLFPNSATEYVNVVVKTTDDFKDVVREVAIVDILGKSIMSKTIEQGENIVKLNVNDLSSGIYLVQIIVDGQQLKVEKLVVN